MTSGFILVESIQPVRFLTLFSGGLGVYPSGAGACSGEGVFPLLLEVLLLPQLLATKQIEMNRIADTFFIA